MAALMPRSNDAAVAYSNFNNAARNHQKFRRPRDKLRPRQPTHKAYTQLQTQINLAGMKLRSKKKFKPSRSTRETLNVLRGLLQDPDILFHFNDLVAVRPQEEVPEAVSAAILSSARTVFGPEARLGPGPVSGSRKSLAIVSSGPAVSTYDRVAMAQLLEAELGNSTVKTRRRGLMVSLPAADGQRASFEFEIFLGPAPNHRGSHLRRKPSPCSFPCPYFVGAEDWKQADEDGQEKVRGCSKTSWAVALLQHLCTSSTFSQDISDSPSTQRKIFAELEMVLRHLALRIQERDGPEDSRQDFFDVVGHGDSNEIHSNSLHAGKRLLVSLASEILDWHRSTVLNLWLKDAEISGGQRGQQYAEMLLSTAAENLDAAVWSLSHTQIFPLPSPQDKSTESIVDRSITQSVRHIHFSQLSEAEEQLCKAKASLGEVEKHTAGEVHRLLGLAALLSSALLQKRKGRQDKAKQLSARCSEELRTLEGLVDGTPARPLACWHNLGLLLRVRHWGLSSAREDGEYQVQGPSWSTSQSAGMSKPEQANIENSHLDQDCRRSQSGSSSGSSSLLDYLMPLTEAYYKPNYIEVRRVERGLWGSLHESS